MTTRTDHTRACPLCGKEIHYTCWEEDGYDWLGHHRGSYSSERNGYECECDKITFKRMCHNCKFYTGNCTNKSIMEKYRKKISDTMPFNIGNFEMSIKHPERSCSCWSIKDSIIDKLFKKQEQSSAENDESI